MKLATFGLDGRDRIGVVTADGRRLIDLAAAGAAAAGVDVGAFRSMQSLIEAGDPALDLARRVADIAQHTHQHQVPIEAVALRAPLPIPAQIRDFSLFPTHIKQSRQGMARLARQLLGQDLPGLSASGDGPLPRLDHPPYYLSNRFSVIGPDEAVRWPRYSHYMDFELELAIVIGRTGKDIRVEQAAGHIFGYTIYNDFSARDTQLVEMQAMLGPAKGKGFDTGNALGPFIVTPEEIPNPRALRAIARVNGETWADETCGAMMHSFEEIIAILSRDETLHAGEVIGSGTVGNGCGLEHSRFLADGDVVELEFPAIGVLRNRVVRQ